MSKQYVAPMIIALALGWTVPPALAQSSEPSLEQIKSRNPALKVTPPDSATPVAKALRDIIEKLRDPPGPGQRGLVTPTPAERAQLKRNPDFARAYAVSPEETLHLLRRVNQSTGRS